MADHINQPQCVKGSRVENSSGSILGLIFIFVLFFFLISAFVIQMYFRSWTRNREQDLKSHLVSLRQYQEELHHISLDAEIYSEHDPEPFGSLARQISTDLLFSSRLLQDLFAIYASNKTLLRRFSHPVARELKDFPAHWRELNRGMDRFEADQDKVEQHIHLIEKNFERLSNITLEVEKNSKKILELILLTKQKIKELEQLPITDEEFYQLARSLEEWEQTAVQQIPVQLLAGKYDARGQDVDKVYIAKAFRLLNTIEPEIKKLGMQVADWQSQYDRIQQIQKEITEDRDRSRAVLDELSQNKVMSVDWGAIEQEAERLSAQFESATSQGMTVSEFSQFLSEFDRLKERLTENLTQINTIKKSHQDLVERIRKRQPFHQLEWAKNAAQTMQEAKDYNPENWPGLKVEQLMTSLLDTVHSQANSIIQDPPRHIAANQLLDYLDVLRSLDAEYARLSSEYQVYFQGLQELRRQEDRLKAALSQYYASLRQLADLVSSNPSLKKMALSELQKTLQSIEEVNQSIADRSQGRLQQKAKRWKSLSTKINQTIVKIDRKLADENQLLFIKLREQVDLLQDYLNLDEAVFSNAIGLLKEDKVGQPGSPSGQDENLPVLEMANKIKTKNNIWQRLIASTNALSEISGPISERLDKLEKNKRQLSDLMKEAETKVPEQLSWPPTTKRLALERTKFGALEEKYRNLKTNRGSAVQLVALLSDLAEQYRELYLTVRAVVSEAESEQKKFTELEKRLNISIEMWQKVAKTYKSNLLLVENIQDFLGNTNRDYLELQKRYRDGKISYPQAYQMFRIICRKIDQEPVEYDDSRIIDINGEIQQKL